MPAAFTGATLDRATELRADPGRVAELLDATRAAVLAATADGVLIETNPRAALARLSLDAGRVDPGQPLLLGIERGTALFATDLEGLDEAQRRPLLEAAEVVSLREAGLLLPPEEGGLAAYMVALLNWHRRHRFCANCGAPTAVAEAGLSRRCGNCGASHFPRTDPVVIMLVEHQDRLLLGSRAGWPENRYSILAGFVAPGETPEEAVVREVLEESGIAADSPTYVSSQPWPFPSSLMLGFEALSDGGEPSAKDGELADVAWFAREQVRAAQRDQGEIQLPGRVSIARMLIDRWAARER